MQRLVEVSRTINDRRHHKQGTSVSNVYFDVFLRYHQDEHKDTIRYRY